MGLNLEKMMSSFVIRVAVTVLFTKWKINVSYFSTVVCVIVAINSIMLLVNNFNITLLIVSVGNAKVDLIIFQTILQTMK